jgi:pyruvate carboxylase
MQAMYSRPTKAERLEAQISSTSGVSAMSDELKPWTPEHVKSLLDEWGILTDLPRSEYERISNEHNADLNATLENIWELAAKAQAIRDVPNEHERKLYQAIEAVRSRAAVKERGEDTKLREKWERELSRSANVSGRSAYSYIEEFLQDLSQQ